MSASLFAHATPDTVTIYSVDLFPGDMMDAHQRNLEQAGAGSERIRSDYGVGYCLEG
jgi:predicted O-methyltransferase YrrM